MAAKILQDAAPSSRFRIIPNISKIFISMVLTNLLFGEFLIFEFEIFNVFLQCIYLENERL